GTTMSTGAPSQPPLAPPGAPALAAPAPAQGAGSPLVINGLVRIPAGITDQASFRAWTHSPGFPERGRFCWLAGTLWVDLTMEQLYSHNQVKTECAAVLHPLVKQSAQGLYLGDGMQLSIPSVTLTTVPDGLFVSFAALQSGRVRQVPSARHGGV